MPNKHNKDGRKLSGFLPFFLLWVGTQQGRKPEGRPIATLFPACVVYNLPERGEGRDGGVSGQRVFLQRPAGLPPSAGLGPAGGHPPAPEAVRPLRPAGRAVCGGGVSAGMGLSGGGPGKGRGGGASGAGSLRRGTALSAAGPADLCRGLRSGRDGAGPGPGGGTEHPQRPGRLLYQYQWKDPAAFRNWSLSAADGDLPGGCRPWCPGRATGCAGVFAGTDCVLDGPPGHWPQPPGRLW